MKLGSFYLGWDHISEPERIELELPSVVGGWEVLCIEFAGYGFTLSARHAKRP